MGRPAAGVVGQGPGVGSALAGCFARAGMAVAVARRNPERLAELAEEIGAKAYDCDATDGNAVEALFAAVEDDLGRPVLTVYNVGAYKPGGILALEAEDFERCWRIGCLGGFHVGRAAARRLVGAGEGTVSFTGANAAFWGSRDPTAAPGDRGGEVDAGLGRVRRGGSPAVRRVVCFKFMTLSSGVGSRPRTAGPTRRKNPLGRRHREFARVLPRRRQMGSIPRAAN